MRYSNRDCFHNKRWEMARMSILRGLGDVLIAR